MNLCEVIVAATVFLGACSGAAQMGSSSAEAMTASRQRSVVLEQIEAQFLAVDPLLRDAAPPELLGCSAAAQWMRQHLDQGLPPLAAGLQRQVNLSSSGEEVQVVFVAGDVLKRSRLLSPAAYGLCVAAAAPLDQESTHVTP